MQRITGWIIAGFMTMALWVPGAHAQFAGAMPQGRTHTWRAPQQERQEIHRNQPQPSQDRRAGNRETIVSDRGPRADLHTDHRPFWRPRPHWHHEWYGHGYGYGHYGRW